jgi:hypothetical protein
VKDDVNADGTKLQIWDCTEGNTNQQFVVVSNAGGLIQWVGTNKCIDLTNGAMADNTQLQIWTCGIGNTNQVDCVLLSLCTSLTFNFLRNGLLLRTFSEYCI